MTLAQQTIDNGDGSATYRVYYRFSSTLWADIAECGYAREDLVVALAPTVVDYVSIAPTQACEVLFEANVPYTDEVIGGDNPNVNKSFFTEEFSQVQSVAGDYQSISTSMANLFKYKLPSIHKPQPRPWWQIRRRTQSPLRSDS